MPRRNRNAGTEPINCDRLAYEAAQLARELAYEQISALLTLGRQAAIPPGRR